jgi:hypothetical protein
MTPALSRLAAAYAQTLGWDRREFQAAMRTATTLADVPEPIQGQLRAFAEEHPDPRWPNQDLLTKTHD